MQARRMEERAIQRNVLDRLGLYAGHNRVTETSVRTAGLDGNIAALPPMLDLPATQTADGEFVFVLGVDALDSDAVIL